MVDFIEVGYKEGVFFFGFVVFVVNVFYVLVEGIVN